MTLKSLVQQNDSPPNPAYIDSGPYPRDDWAKKLIIEWVGDAVTTRGPFAKYLNRLEVTNPAGVTIRLDTGSGYCNGSLMENDAQLDFAANVPAIPSRTDKVVLVENNTNAVYDGTASGVVLDFPTSLVDYKGVASIPEYTCRPAILRGDAATGAATALIQTTSYWMVELFRFDVSSGGAVSNLADNRDYVDAETKYVFVPALVGYNVTDALSISPATVFHNPGLKSAASVLVLPQSKNSYGVGNWSVPADYIEALQCRAVVIAPTGVSGNLFHQTTFTVQDCGNTTTSTHTHVPQTTTFASGQLQCIPPAPLVGAAVLPYAPIYMEMARLLGGSDTLSGDAYLLGFRMEYLGYR